MQNDKNLKDKDTGIMASGRGAATIKKQFAVTGMGCAACANRIETTLNKQPGVIKGTVNYATQTAQVDFDPGIVQPLQLKESIQSIGYDLITGETESAREEVQDLQKKNLNP
jgi:copper chaperone CopZ